MECVKHPGNQTALVCVTCNSTPVCLECLTDEQHKCHEFGKQSETESHTNKSEENVESELILGFMSDLEEARRLKTQQNQEHLKRQEFINIRRKDLMDTINKIADSIISHSQTQTRGNCDILQGAIDGISSTLEKVRRDKEENNDPKRVIDDKDPLQMEEELGIKECNERDRKPLPKLETFEFIYGEVNTSQLKLMFGVTKVEIEEVESLQGAQPSNNTTLSINQNSDSDTTLICQGGELVPEATFKLPNASAIIHMCFTCCGKTWIRCINAQAIILRDKSGDIEKTVTFDSIVAGMTVVSDNTLLICGEEDKDIKQVTLSSGEVTSLFLTGDLSPVDICASPSGDIYVTQMDKFDYNVTSDSKRVLVHYSAQGHEKDRQGDAMFVWPWKVRMSHTGDDIGVINATDKDNNHLVLLNTDLALRSRYLGHGNVVSRDDKFDTTTYKPSREYYINDFIFDKAGNIIICEANTKCVQLLSSDCVPMMILLPEQESLPMSMAMMGDEVCLGFENGTLKMCKLK